MSCRRSTARPAIRPRPPTWCAGRMGAGEVREGDSSRHRLERSGRDGRHGHRPHRSRLRQGGFPARQGAKACRRSRRSMSSASSYPASASWPASPPSITRPPTGFWPICSKRACLLAVEKYPHSYPHCWRCKTELLFRLVDEWFINMNWRDEIKEVVRADAVGCRSRSTARPASWIGSRTWATG